MNIEEKIGNLEKSVTVIQERNKKVEADKAWETSLVRKLVVLLLTYLVMVVFMHFFQISNPWLNAVIPSLAFLLSTLTLPFIKKTWTKKKI